MSEQTYKSTFLEEENDVLAASVNALDRDNNGGLNMKPETIIAQVCAAYDVTLEDLRSRSRRAALVRARHAAMYAVRQHTDLSYPAIGRFFNRHHTAVMHAVDRMEGARRVNRHLDQLLEEVA